MAGRRRRLRVSPIEKFLAFSKRREICYDGKQIFRGARGKSQSEPGQDRNVAALRTPILALSFLRFFLWLMASQHPEILFQIP